MKEGLHMSDTETMAGNPEKKILPSQIYVPVEETDNKHINKYDLSSDEKGWEGR